MSMVEREPLGTTGEVAQGKAVGIDHKSGIWVPATGKICHQCGKRMAGGITMYWVGATRADGKEVNVLCCQGCSIAHLNGTQKVTIEGRKGKQLCHATTTEATGGTTDPTGGK